MLGGTYDGGGAFLVGLQGHVICCSGRLGGRLAAAAVYAIHVKGIEVAA